MTLLKNYACNLCQHQIPSSASGLLEGVALERLTTRTPGEYELWLQHAVHETSYRRDNIHLCEACYRAAQRFFRTQEEPAP